MKKLLLTVTVFVAVITAARAEIIDDPLHGYCSAGCADNGTNTPIGSNPPQNFGFTVSPGAQTGDLTLDFLIPDTAPIPALFGGIHITGADTATAKLFSTTAWTTGTLATYLGLTASPNNPIGAYLPSSQSILSDPLLSGFFVFQADVGTQTLPGPSGTPPLFDIDKFAQGGYIVGFLNTGTGDIATANSGALFETTSGNTINPLIPGVPEPSTWAMMILGFAGVGFMAYRRSRKDNNLALAAA